MRRIAAEQVAATFELRSNLALDGARVIEVDALVAASPRVAVVRPLAQIDVQANAQRGLRPGAGRGRLRGGPADHQARARHDPVLVRLDDAPVDAGTLTEVVGVDDQRSCHRAGNVRNRIARPARCEAGSARDWPWQRAATSP